jgi:hypothetical protein
MTQPTADQLRAIVENAATAILGGGALDDMTRFQAAGCAVKLANDDNEDEVLNLVILIANGNYEQAAAALMKLALSQGGNQSGPAFDPLAGLLNTPPATAATPAPDPAPAAAPAPASTDTRRPRRAPRGTTPAS